jgi:hypothetical protein
MVTLLFCFEINAQLTCKAACTEIVYIVMIHERQLKPPLTKSTLYVRMYEHTCVFLFLGKHSNELLRFRHFITLQTDQKG